MKSRNFLKNHKKRPSLAHNLGQKPCSNDGEWETVLQMSGLKCAIMLPALCALFVLQFDRSEIPRLVARYGPEQDNAAFAAGSRIASGNYSRENLKIIVRWKSARKIAFIDENADVEIDRALRFVSNAQSSESLAIQVLDNLHGIGIPMASAILTTINPINTQ